MPDLLKLAQVADVGRDGIAVDRGLRHLLDHVLPALSVRRDDIAVDRGLRPGGRRRRARTRAVRRDDIAVDRGLRRLCAVPTARLARPSRRHRGRSRTATCTEPGKTVCPPLGRDGIAVDRGLRRRFSSISLAATPTSRRHRGRSRTATASTTIRRSGSQSRDGIAVDRGLRLVQAG